MERCQPPRVRRANRTEDDQFSSYSCDVRDLVEQVKNGKTATDTSPKISRFTHTARGETDVETKADGNTVDFDYYLDGLVASQVEKKPRRRSPRRSARPYRGGGRRGRRCGSGRAARQEWWLDTLPPRRGTDEA
ncbi:hypothetical protein [Kribbella sp. NPDC023855]|uniref:hypothetical protein n=1 Tax=Kribbella sp. NPDC023855 TaxID=3154698 RepID=UPI0033F7EE49